MDWTFALGNLTFGLFDVITLAFIVIGGVTGTAMGFTRSACKILGHVLCFPIALLFTGVLHSFLSSKMIIPSPFGQLLCFAVLCVVVFVLFRLLGNLLASTIETLGLGVLDSVLGFAWGLCLALAVLFLLLEVLSLQPFIDFSPLKECSLIYTRIFCRLFPTAKAALEAALHDIR